MLVRATALALPLADESVQCIVTSPPYWGLRDYGVPGQLGLEPTPDEYVERMVEVGRELRRVLRPDGVLWLNLGDSYAAGKLGRADTSGAAAARRAAVFGSGTGPGCGPREFRQRSAPEGLKPKDLVGIPWRVALALQADGWYLRADVIWAKPNPMPESVTDRPTKAHEYVFLLARSESYYFGADAIRERGCGRAPSPGHKHMTHGGHLRNDSARLASHLEAVEWRNVRSVWTMASEPYAGAHFATMPPTLARRCILAGSRPGDRVLDPFAGSGTTVRVARELGRRGVGVDLNRTYLHEQAAVRIRCTAGLGL